VDLYIPKAIVSGRSARKLILKERIIVSDRKLILKERIIVSGRSARLFQKQKVVEGR
jgi:hypothetical protein